jgi:preprotein translocase subunit SecE
MQNPITLAVNYIKSSVAELKKVTWPTRDQTIRYSVLVIMVSVAVAAFFASLDFGFSRGILYAVSKSPHSSAPSAASEAPPVTPDLVPTPEAPAPTQTPSGQQGLPIEINPSTPSTNEPPKDSGTPAPALPDTNPIQLPKN